MSDIIVERIEESIAVKKNIIENPFLIKNIHEAEGKVISSIENGGKLVLCGNGGSASDAMHFAGEIVGRFQRERQAWPAIVLNADPVTLTAISNDYDYNNVFLRQTEAFVTTDDVFLGISTSGNSENIYRAAKKVKERGIYTIGLLGNDGGKIADIIDLPLIVPCNVTARIQESHIVIIHIICELVENGLVDR